MRMERINCFLHVVIYLIRSIFFIQYVPALFSCSVNRSFSSEIRLSKEPFVRINAKWPSLDDPKVNMSNKKHTLPNLHTQSNSV